MQTIGCPTCGNSLMESDGYCTRCGEFVLSSDSTIRLPHKAIKRQSILLESEEAEATIPLSHPGRHEPRAFSSMADEAESTIRLTPGTVRRENKQPQGPVASTRKLLFMRPGARASLEQDLQASLDETAQDDLDDELLMHHGTWQKVVDHKTSSYAIPTILASSQAKRAPLWLSTLIRQKTARSFFWLSTLILVALLLSGAFGLAASFGRTVRQTTSNPPPTLLASPATIALGGIVTLRGTYFTPGGAVTLSRDQHIPLVDTGGLNTIQADDHGLFSDTFVVDPMWLSGSHTLYATDVHTHKQALFPLIVTGQDALQGPPHLLLSSSTLNLGSGDETTNASGLLALSNAGGGQATWQASVSQPWLQITPTSGSIASGRHLSVIVTAVRSNLAPGSYQAAIVFTSNTGQDTLTVTMKVIALQPRNEAIMQISPGSLAFNGAALGATPGVQTITISNPGTLPLNWSASVSNSWLWAAPFGGTIDPGGQQQITVGVTTGGLANGVYKGTITFARQGSAPVQDSPQSVYVSLTITPACTLTFSKNSLSFKGLHGGAAPADQSLNIGVAQGCATSEHWKVATSTSSGGNWLTMSSSSGAVPATVKVGANTSGLAPGTYTGTLTFTDSVGSKMLDVTLTVTPIPCTVSGPSALAMQGTAAQSNAITQSVTINASGDCQQTLVWTSSVSDSSWLSASASGTLVSSATVNIQTSLANLSAGTYNGSVTITVVDSTTAQTVGIVVVSVTLTAVAPPPPCTLQTPSASALSFTASAGSNPATPTASFTLSVTGSCAGSVTITPTIDTAGSGWLSITGPVTVASGASATFTVTVASAGQTTGTYTSTITLSADSSISGSPRTVTVTLTVQ